MRAAALALLVLAAFVATLTIPSPQAQAPEATPELTPEFTVGPIDSVRRVLSSEAPCVLLHDETRIAVANRGVVNLVTGEVEIPFDPPLAMLPLFPAGENRLGVAGSGIYDLVSNQKLLDLSGTTSYPMPHAANVWLTDAARTRYFVAEERLYATSARVMIYDINTLELLFNRDNVPYPPPADPYRPATVMAPGGLTVTEDVVIAHDGVTATVYDLHSGELLYTRDFNRAYRTLNDDQWLAVMGEDIRDLKTNSLIFDGLPDIVWNRLGFSADYTYLFLYSPDFESSTVYDLFGDREPVTISLVPDDEQIILTYPSYFYERFDVNREAGEIVVAGIELSRTRPQPAPRGVNYIYSLADGTRLRIEDANHPLPFFPEDPVPPVELRSDGFYRTDTGALIVENTNENYGHAVYDENYTIAAVPDEGVYDLVEGRRLYDIGAPIYISLDGRFIYQERYGILDARTGRLIFAHSGRPIQFSRGSRYAWEYRRDSCVVYALPGTPVK
ncbi:MAG: hypothetical protein IPM16_20370 [Chloroflexi bacterium]|nr:hypothetical protein [Chloroflexota bacterium]